MPHRTAAALLLACVLAGCDPKKAPTPAPSPAPGPSGPTAPDASPGQQPLTKQDRIAYAKQLLADAGYKDGKGFPKLEILYNTDEGHKKIAAAIQQMWRQNLGIEVELRNTEWKKYLDDMSKVSYQVMRRGWIGDYRDPNTFIDMFTSTSGNNNTNWKNADYDKLVKAAGAEPDPAKRLDILRQAEKILMTELPIMPIYYYVSSNCWTDAVKGVYANIQDSHTLTEAYIEGKQTLTINNATEIQTLDPGLARGVPEHRILVGLFEGLTSLDPKTLDPRPGIAEKWDLSPDGRTYTFHLREANWSDGKPVTAKDFEYAWMRVLDPATPTDYAHQLYYIKGAEDYREKKTGNRDAVGIKVVNDRTIQVELTNPCTFFLDLCAFYTYYPVRKDVIDKHGPAWTKPENFVSNGAFRLKDWKPTDHILIEKNPAYWNAKVVRQPFIKFLPIENRSTAWNLYKEGTCDWVTTLPLEQIEEIIKRPDYRGDVYLGTYFYSFNVDDPALKDRRVRKALTLAIDREIIVTKITKQGQTPAYHYTPPIFEAYKSPRYDVKD